MLYPIGTYLEFSQESSAVEPKGMSAHFLKWLDMFNAVALLNAQGQRGNAILLNHIRSPARLAQIPNEHLVHFIECRWQRFVLCMESHLEIGSLIKDRKAQK